MRQVGFFASLPFLKRFRVFHVCSALEFMSVPSSFFYDLCVFYLMYACNLVIDVKLIVKMVNLFSIETNKGSRWIRGSVLLLQLNERYNFH